MDMASDLLQPSGDDAARIAWYLRDLISKYQKTFTVIEKVAQSWVASPLPTPPLPTPPLPALTTLLFHSSAPSQ